MAAHRIHLISHANPLRPDLKRFGFASAEEYVAYAAAHLPPPWRLTYEMRILEALEDEWRGGRSDDDLRIADLNDALADPRTRAIVAANGGSYLARILPHLDFSALTRRRTPLWALGFSELSNLVNIVAGYSYGRGLYGLCPNWLGWKLPREQARAALAEFWRTLPDVLEERAPGKTEHLRFGPLVGELVSGRLPQVATNALIAQPVPGAKGGAPDSPRAGRRAATRSRGAARTGRWRACGEVRVVGGCLAVLATIVGSPLARRIRPDGKWLMLEDIRENPFRIDRFLAALKLAGWFERVSGLLIGDFRMLHADTQPAVLELLKYHLPRRDIPVVTTRSFGHVWPMLPVPLNRPLPLGVRGPSVRFG